MGEKMTLTIKWEDARLIEDLEAMAREAMARAAEAGVRVTRGVAPGSVKANLSVTEKIGGKSRGAGGRFVKGGGKHKASLWVNVRSRERSGSNDKVPYHSAYTEWGTARQPGQHFGLKGLKAARQTLDREADGMLA